MLGGSELENLRAKDVGFAYKTYVGNPTIRISHSKTDQIGVGCCRTLSMADSIFRLWLPMLNLRRGGVGIVNQMNFYCRVYARPLT